MNNLINLSQYRKNRFSTIPTVIHNYKTYSKCELMEMVAAFVEKTRETGLTPYMRANGIALYKALEPKTETVEMRAYISSARRTLEGTN
jgi:hypothetical protein